MFVLFGTATARAETTEYSPHDGATIETSRPTVSVTFPRSVDVKSLFIMVDDLDVTSEATITDNNISYVVALPLPPGSHDVIVQGVYADSGDFTHWWSFTSKEVKKTGPDRVEARTEMNTNAFWLGNDNDRNGALPEHGVEVFGPTHFRVAEGKTSFEMRGNFHYLDQDGPVVAPGVEEGADFRDFLIVSRFAGENFTTEIGAGDITIQETSLTLPGMQRRGVYLQQVVKGVTARLFTINASPVFGVRDGLEIESGREEALAGASVDIASADNLSRFHLTLLSGSDRTGTGFSQADAGTRSEGKTVGAAWHWNLASGKARGVVEVAVSDFEADADSATSRSEEDLAYKLGLAWAPTSRYEAALDVEELGTDYVSIGQPGIVNDVRRVALRNGFYSSRNRFDLTVGYAVDNLDNNSAIATTNLWQFRGEDSYRYSDHLNLLIGFSREVVESEDEPVNFLPAETVTDQLDLAASWVYDKWSFAPRFVYAERDDRTSTNADTELSEWRADMVFRPSSQLLITMILPQVIIEDDKLTGTERQTELVSILLNATALEDLLQFDLSGSWLHNDASDSSLDETRADYSVRAAVSLKRHLPEYFQPSLYLQGLYSRIENDVLATKQDEFTLYLGIEVFSGFGL